MTDRRVTMAYTMMEFARLLAERSTCERLAVGAVVTDASMLQVLGIGYNGSARGLPNHCEDPNAPGACGCVHAEANALLKAPGALPHKKLFTTASPCVACAKLILNGGIDEVYYTTPFRDPRGDDLLRSAGIALIRLPVKLA